MTGRKNQINRRSYLSQVGYGLGLISTTSPFKTFISFDSQSPRTAKKLFATTEYIGSVFRYQSYLTRPQIDDLNKQLVSLGVTRHQWFYDDLFSFYENHPFGLDLLSEAVESAHGHGLEFYALIKPFEGGGSGDSLPHSLPFPKSAPAFKDIRGISSWARPFAAKNPHMNLKRRPGEHRFSGSPATIRLIKSDDRPTRIKAEHLVVYTSLTNNHFSVYNGPVVFRESVEMRFRFPKWRPCRILHLEKLQIPQDHKYILLKCALADEAGDFSNENGNILEMEDLQGRIIPHTLSTGPVTWEDFQKTIEATSIWKSMSRYWQMPELQEEFRDKDRMKNHFDQFYSFNKYELTDWTTFDRQGYIAAACGKPEYMLGNMHPIYPEVREHWLKLVRYCLDRGVDGINFRVANHVRFPDYWEYGFNEPVLEASGGKTDYPTISRINGNAYTQFLREARHLIKSRKKGLTIHLHAGMLIPDDRERLHVLPPNFEWQWETWVREIGDEFHFRGSWTLRPWNLNKALDAFSASAKAVNKPIYFQSDFHGMTNNEGRRQSRLDEIELVKKHPGLSGYILYTSNNYTTMNEDGRIEVLPFMKSALRSYYK